MYFWQREVRAAPRARGVSEHGAREEAALVGGVVQPVGPPEIRGIGPLANDSHHRGRQPANSVLRTLSPHAAAALAL